MGDFRGSIDRVLVVIPAYNEAATIGAIVEGTRRHGPEILVVDDGSKDRTAALASAAGASVCRLEKNQGKGEALKAGFRHAMDSGYDYVITLDSDGQHDPDDIAFFLPLLPRYNLVLGNRMEDRRRMPLLRRIANTASSYLVSALCGQTIRDSQTGFRAYDVRFLREIALRRSRYDLETEVILEAAHRGCRIGHCRIKTIYAGQTSRIGPVRDSLRFLRVCFGFLFRR